MNLTQAQVLITGGSDGIGRGLAERFLAAGATVLVTGRSRAKLDALPTGLLTLASDAGDPAQREALAARALALLPGLNVLVNNAGLQRRVSLAADTAPWAERQREIDVLLAGPVHLAQLLAPALATRPSLLVNVTSGGAYVPQVFAPLYSACKAALHHHTVLLRDALAGTPCRVVELIPPAVKTGLSDHGVALDAFCDDVFPRLFTEAEVGYGPTADIGRLDLAAAFRDSAARSPVQRY